MSLLRFHSRPRSESAPGPLERLYGAACLWHARWHGLV